MIATDVSGTIQYKREPKATENYIQLWFETGFGAGLLVSLSEKELKSFLQMIKEQKLKDEIV